ncbi:MAG TPA: DUF1552 domain-containing protein, partial [Nannocystaceae bacterium]|nr:DUF1552 domain-containing protein [Nannocystaceae bacterium]
MSAMTRAASRRASAVLFAWACSCGDSAEDDSGDTSSTGATSSGAVDDTGTSGTSSAPADSSTTFAADTTTDSGDSTGDSTGGPPIEPPTRLLVIRTPHGAYADQLWTGGGEGFELGPVLEPLAPWSDALVLVDGIDNEIIAPDGESITNVYGVSSAALLTGGLLGSSTGDPDFRFYLGGGPSIDVVLGAELGASTPAANVHLGVFASDQQYPTGVS